MEKKTTSASSSDVVYDKLKNQIIELHIKPGQVVSIKDLVEELNVGRSPVRDAIIKLEKEGLIASLPQRGTMISKIDFKRVCEERFLRECIEEKVALLFLKMQQMADIKMLEGLIECQKEKIADRDFRGFLNLDEEFHKVFFDRTKKELCWETIQNQSGHYRRVRLLSAMDKEIAKNVISEHVNIVNCLKERDEKKLLQILDNHLSKLDIEEKDLLYKYSDLFEHEEKNDRAEESLKDDFLKQITKTKKQ